MIQRTPSQRLQLWKILSFYFSAFPVFLPFWLLLRQHFFSHRLCGSKCALSFCACFMTVSPPWRLYSCCPVFEAPITLCTPHHSWPWDDKHFHHFSPTNFYCDIWTHQSPSRPAFTGLFVSIPSHHTSPYKPFCLPSMRPFLHARVMMRTTAALLSLYFWVNTDIHAAQTGE